MERKTAPACILNADLDCPEDCSFYPFARGVLRKAAQATGFSQQALKDAFRSRKSQDKTIINIDNNAHLQHLGIDGDCANKDRACYPNFGRNE